MSSPIASMERTRFIIHRAKKILLLDYTNLGNSPEQLQEEIARTRQLISTQPPGSLLIVTDVRGSRITPGNVKAMQELVRHNAPYVKWSAVVVGLTGVYLTAFRAIQVVSRRRNLNAFNDLEEAKNWLVSQP
ncbi:MAG TPA: hypothetical protein VFR81_16985 [Longimicrobium sp.]|nr:hypothetical protein [Longimicrobium sp.]